MKNERLMIGTRKGLFLLRRGRNSKTGWRIEQTAFLGVGVTATLFDPRSGHLYAAAGHGHFGAKLHKSTDGGKTWPEIAVPVYPPKPDDAPAIVHPFTHKEIPWSLEYIWTLETGAGDSEIWCGTIPSGLFRSDDAGQTWTFNRTLWDRPERAHWFGGGFDSPGLHSICVDPRDRNHVLIALSSGGVWRTRDNGETWECATTGMRCEYMPPGQEHESYAQDPHRMVQCPAKPDVLWVQHHNGMYRSANNSASWDEITGVKPSVFGFAVAVHPNDPDTAWFVPAIKDEARIAPTSGVCLTRTRDGGKTFEILTKGLPGEHAYDLVFRHGLDVDASGERLAFGSTTGNVWATENGGDVWETVSNYLPPVYCVRFY